MGFELTISNPPHNKEYHDEELRKLWFIDDELWCIIDKRIPDYYKDYRYK